MRNHTQNDAIWGLIVLFLTNQIAENTIDFKMNVINSKIRHAYYGCRNVSIFDVMYMYLNTPYIDNNTVICMSFC